MIIVSHFDNFGSDSLNSSEIIAKSIKEKRDDIYIVGLPTVFQKSGEILIKEIEANRPDLIIMLGQAGGRSALSIEKIAINLMEASIKDNEGNKPSSEPVVAGGPDGYFSTLPVTEMIGRLRSEKIPGYISYSAGTYVCNCLMYQVMNYIKSMEKPPLAGFIHIPYLPVQVLDRPGVASTCSAILEKALEIIIDTSMEKRK